MKKEGSSLKYAWGMKKAKKTMSKNYLYMQRERKRVGLFWKSWGGEEKQKRNQHIVWMNSDNKN